MKRKSLREVFEENYAAVREPAKNSAGFKIRYVYYAPWYIWCLGEKELRREKILLLTLSLVSLAVFTASVMPDSELNTQRLLFALCAASLCAHILELSALVQFAAAKRKTSRMTYNDITKLLGTCPLLRAALLEAAALGSVLYMLFVSFSALSLAVTAGYAVSGAMAWVIYKRYGRIPFTTEKNTVFEELEGKKGDVPWPSE